MYFPNGTSVMSFQETRCWHCVNWRDDGNSEGCPVMDLHILPADMHLGDDAHPAHWFIPNTPDGDCKMFLRKGEDPPSVESLERAARMKPWLALPCPRPPFDEWEATTPNGDPLG